MFLRNLLIVHTAPYQDIADWLEVKRRIEEWAPDIDIRILDNNAFDPVIDEWHATRPLLIFSPNWLLNWQPKRGTLYAGARLSKLEQTERLAGHGLPVPPARKLTRNLDVDPAWGDYVIVKQQYGFGGRGVRLVKRQDLADRYEELMQDSSVEKIVQPYVDHSERGYPTHYRVLTLFGHTLHCSRTSWSMQRAPLQEIASDPKGIIASNGSPVPGHKKQRVVWDDPDIIALGERAYAVFPEHPVLAIDIVRDVTNDAFYILEVNPTGPWHLSSNFAKKTYPADFRRDLYTQFSALERVARLLIDKTRAEAK